MAELKVGSSIVDGPLYLGPAGILMSIGLEKVEILWYWDQKTTRHDKEYLNILRLESQSEQIMRVALAAGRLDWTKTVEAKAAIKAQATQIEKDIKEDL